MKKYQWMSNHRGPMGRFSAQKKAALVRAEHPDFTPGEGHWREVSPKEQEADRAYITRLAYEQS